MRKSTLQVQWCLLPLVLMLVCVVSAYADDFTYNGISYTPINATTCQTTPGDELYPGNRVSGDVEIPSIVCDEEGNKYSVTEIGTYSFAMNDISSVVIPSSVESIGYAAFYYCEILESVSLSNSVGAIRGFAFSCCTSLKSIDIPTSVTFIGENAFDASGLTSISIPESIKELSQEVFANCNSLSSVTIPSSVSSIAKKAFYNCQSLTTVTIPSSVTFIGSQAFKQCSNLTVSVLSNNTTPPTISEDTFDTSTYSSAKLIVPSSSVAAYKEATGWKNFGSNIIDETVAGVTEVAGEVTDGAVAVEDGAICVNSNGPVRIVALSGVTLYGGRGNVRVNVAPGIYMVIIGNKVMKVAVK